MSGLSILAAAREVPDRPALIAEGRIWSYAALADQVERLIPLLLASGLGVGTPHSTSPIESTLGEPCAAILGNSRCENLPLVYALLELGVPIIPVHPRWSKEEREEVLEAYGPRVYFDDRTIDELTQWAAEGARQRPRRSPDPESCLALVRTSGTSGRSKGVILSRLAFEASAQASGDRLGWQNEDRWLLSLPLAHVGGLSILTRCLIARRTVVLPSWTQFRVENVLRTVREARVTLLSSVPTMLRRLLATGSPPATLRAVLLGGAAASPTLLAEAAELGWPVLTTYGLTESCSQIALQVPGTVNRGQLGSGPALSGTEIRIGEGGRIEVRGPTLMDSYFPTSLASQRTEEGWFLTSDFGRLDADGHLHVLGRLDDVIITGGENVAPLEVEQVLESYAGVEEALVFGVEDEEWGQAVAVAVVPRFPFSEDELDGILKEVKTRLAVFARPRWLTVLDLLPRNPTGKIDRRRAIEMAKPLLRAIR